MLRYGTLQLQKFKSKGKAAAELVADLLRAEVLLRSEQVPLTTQASWFDRGLRSMILLQFYERSKMRLRCMRSYWRRESRLKTVRKYSWIDGDDLQQELLIPVPRWIGTFAVGTAVEQAGRSICITR